MDGTDGWMDEWMDGWPNKKGKEQSVVCSTLRY